jgi:hypothetical protein
MNRHLRGFTVGAIALAAALVSHPCQGAVSVAYGDPIWTYEYAGAAVAVGTTSNSNFTALDGTWNRPSGSQSWDGSGIGGTIETGNAPGGVSALLDGTTTFVRMQDTGDPRDHAMPDPSNRRMRFGHNLATDSHGLTNIATILHDGVTISFRTRLSTAATGDIDGQYPRIGGENDGTAAGTAWPTGGNGTSLHDGGRGMFTIRQSGDSGLGIPAATIAFGLSFASEDATLTGSGLVATGLTSDTQQVLTLPEDSLDDWHEFWITIRADTSGGGTHRLTVYKDGSLTPTILHVLAPTTGAESGPSSNWGTYLALGPASTSMMGAYDVDFFAWKPGTFTPVQGDFDNDGDVDGADFVAWQTNFPTALGATRAMGDADNDGDVDGADFVVWQTNFPFTPGGAVAPLPEPAAMMLILLGTATLGLHWMVRRSRSKPALVVVRRA